MRQFFWLFVLDCILLGYCGAQSVDAVKFGIPMVWAARIGTAYYYAFFWIIMPVVGLIESPRSLPDSIAKSVLGAPAAAPAE
jgi:ubiquinol-cytochrome c reductase cytochrome b subunit